MIRMGSPRLRGWRIANSGCRAMPPNPRVDPVVASRGGHRFRSAERSAVFGKEIALIHSIAGCSALPSRRRSSAAYFSKMYRREHFGATVMLLGNQNVWHHSRGKRTSSLMPKFPEGQGAAPVTGAALLYICIPPRSIPIFNAHNENDHWGTTPLHAAAHANQAAIA